MKLTNYIVGLALPALLSGCGVTYQFTVPNHTSYTYTIEPQAQKRWQEFLDLRQHFCPEEHEQKNLFEILKAIDEDGNQIITHDEISTYYDLYLYEYIVSHGESRCQTTFEKEQYCKKRKKDSPINTKLLEL